MARQRGLNITLNDLIAAKLMAGDDEITAPELARKLRLIDGYAIMQRLERAGWVQRCRLNYGPSSFSLSRCGHDILRTTILLIRNSAERVST